MNYKEALIKMTQQQIAQKFVDIQMCKSCNKSAPKVTVYDLTDHYIYKWDELCTGCYSHFPKTDPTSKNSDGSLLHHRKCFTGGSCQCWYHYCGVEGCENLRRPTDKTCEKHQLYCLNCKKETFFVAEHAFPEQINNPNRTHTSIIMMCGPCYGYKGRK